MDEQQAAAETAAHEISDPELDAVTGGATVAAAPTTTSNCMKSTSDTQSGLAGNLKAS